MPINLYLDTVFANSGDTSAVPDATQPDGSVSYNQGYGIAYSTAVTSGGLNFPRAQYNQILKDITGALQFQQQNGAFRFITTAMNGGGSPYSYTLGAIVAYDAGAGLQNWVSTASANTTTPGDMGANWTALTALQSGVPGIAINAAMGVTSASTSATFTADQITVATALGGQIFNLTGYSKAINLASTGAGGMDTGSAPTNGYVALYAIYNPTTSTASIMGVDTTSTVAPTIYGGVNLPSGYTASALISVWATNGSAQFIVGHQFGRQINFPFINVLSSSTNHAGYTSLSISSAVPKNAKSCSGFLEAQPGSPTTGVTIASDVSGSGTMIYANPSVATNGEAPFYGLLLPTVQTLYYQSSTVSGTATYGIDISGYTF